YHDKPRRATTWADDVYDRKPNAGINRSATSRANATETFDKFAPNRGSATVGVDNDYVYSDRKPSRPTAPKPVFPQKANPPTLKKDQAVALFTFEADQDGDLGFKKGE